MRTEAARADAEPAFVALEPVPRLGQFLAAVLTWNIEAHLVLLVAAEMVTAQWGSVPAGLTLKLTGARLRASG